MGELGVVWRWWSVSIESVLFELVLFGLNRKKKIGLLCEGVGKSG